MKPSSTVDLHPADYQACGYAVVPEVMSRDLALKLGERIRLRFVDSHRWYLERSGVSSGGGISHYFSLDRTGVTEFVPELIGFYEGLRWLVASVVGEPAVILSPYERSSVNVKLYPPRRGSQGSHRDSNPISALLYLSDEGSATEMTDLQGQKAWSPCRAGNVLIMAGREILHRVPPNESNAPRIVAPMNYYLPWDAERPAWVDRAIYDNVSPLGKG